MKKKKKKLLIIPVIIFSVIALLVIAGLTKTDGGFKFDENIYINGESVRGMTKDKAEKVVSQKLSKDIKDSSIDLKYGDKTWHFSADELKVDDVNIYTGAKFVVVYLGNIMTMPGLPLHPNYEQINIDKEENIKGLF